MTDIGDPLNRPTDGEVILDGDDKQPCGYCGEYHPGENRHDEDGNRAEPSNAELEPVVEAPHLVLDLDGAHATFAAHPKANQYLLVKYVDDLATPGFATVSAVTKLAFGQVLPHEKARLDSFLEEHGHAEDYDEVLYNALSACWKGETMLPLARS